ncbi:MAG: TlpA family protein disulfide reductase [Saprospiraceae bacterium]|nr:TlpA family protein disulfide reductase [Saprospiraceae bacterium]
MATLAGEILECLNKILNALYELRYLNYVFNRKKFIVGTSVPISETESFFRELIDPGDLKIGAKFIETLAGDPDKMIRLYDGVIYAEVDWQKKTMFTQNLMLPMLQRSTIASPFFTRMKGLVKYVLESDRVEVSFSDSRSCTLKVIFLNQLISSLGRKTAEEFSPSFMMGKTKGTEFEIQWDQKSFLPTSLQTMISESKTLETVSNLSIGKLVPDVDFKSFLPEGFITPEASRDLRPYDLIGTRGPALSMTTTGGNKISLEDLKGKVTLLQFTSLVCGPCRLSVNYLKKLRKSFSQEDLSMISLERFEIPEKAIDDYIKEQVINYLYCLTFEQAFDAYKVNILPTFFILDQEKVIRTRITGYEINQTDQKITDCIKRELKSNQ